MAVSIDTELPAVSQLEHTLSDLLQRARKVKLATTVDPALSTSDFVQAVESLKQDILQTESSSLPFTLLETAVRKIFYTTIRSTTIHEPEFVQIWNLLDILLICAEKNIGEQILPLYLLEELVETQTTDCCRTVFDYMESRKARLFQKEFYKIQLVPLRLCNELLRRLSRAEDAVFCGRVFFFLFQSFPLGDPSSVNLRGEFHIDNVTNYEQDPIDSSKSAEAMDVDSIAKEEAAQEADRTNDMSMATQAIVSGKETTKPDRDASYEETSKLYPIFWGLQQYFSMPTRLFDEEQFSVFKRSLEATMTKFEQTPTVVQTKTMAEEPRGTKRKVGDDNGDYYHNNYNPKYLTSRDLFELELTDLAFQRHILVQALILIDFLLSLTEKSKKILAQAKLRGINQSVSYPYTLGDDDTKWVTSTRNKITNYLKKAPDGHFYTRMVDTVISRDKNWVRWKMEKCPAIVADAVSSEDIAVAKTSARHATANRRLKARPMGAIDLTFLADADNGLERLKDPTRFKEPSIDGLMRGVANDELDLEMATQEERKTLEAAKDSKLWRALRIATRTRFSKLDRLDLGKSLQNVFETKDDSIDVAVDGADEVKDPEVKTPEVQVA